MSTSRRQVLTDLLDAPALSAAILGASAVHVGLCAVGLGGWPCPFYHATGWPCPGCGLGRACALLLRGEWRESLRTHACAPILLLTLGVLGAGLLLKGNARLALSRGVAWLEERLFISSILLSGLVVYWLLRLVLDGSGMKLVVS